MSTTNGNRFTGEVPLALGERTVTLRLTWDSHEKLIAAFGEDYDAALSDVRRLSEVVAILSNGSVTAEEVFQASPPLGPTVATVQEALLLGWKGPEGALEKEAPGGPDPLPASRPNGASAPSSRRRRKRASVQPSSGT